MLSGRQTREGSEKPSVRPTWRPANLAGRRGAFVPDTPWSMNAPTLRARQTQPIARSGGGASHLGDVGCRCHYCSNSHAHTHTRLTTSFSRATWVSRYQKGKTSLDSNEAREDGGLGMQWHQLDRIQTICTSLQTDNHTNTLLLNFYRPDALPDAELTVSKH